MLAQDSRFKWTFCLEDKIVIEERSWEMKDRQRETAYRMMLLSRMCLRMMCLRRTSEKNEREARVK